MKTTNKSFPLFSKILECIMYNSVYKHVTLQNLLYNKQFGLQNKCSTEHAILQLTAELHDSFDKNEFTLGAFVDLRIRSHFIFSQKYFFS